MFLTLPTSRQLQFSSGPLKKDNLYSLYCAKQASNSLWFSVCAPHT